MNIANIKCEGVPLKRHPLALPCENFYYILFVLGESVDYFSNASELPFIKTL